MQHYLGRPHGTFPRANVERSALTTTAPGRNAVDAVAARAAGAARSPRTDTLTYRQEIVLGTMTVTFMSAGAGAAVGAASGAMFADACFGREAQHTALGAATSAAVLAVPVGIAIFVRERRTRERRQGSGETRRPGRPLLPRRVLVPLASAAFGAVVGAPLGAVLGARRDCHGGAAGGALAGAGEFAAGGAAVGTLVALWMDRSER